MIYFRNIRIFSTHLNKVLTINLNCMYQVIDTPSKKEQFSFHFYTENYQCNTPFIHCEHSKLFDSTGMSIF